MKRAWLISEETAPKFTKVIASISSHGAAMHQTGEGLPHKNNERLVSEETTQGTSCTSKLSALCWPNFLVSFGAATLLRLELEAVNLPLTEGMQEKLEQDTELSSERACGQACDKSCKFP